MVVITGLRSGSNGYITYVLFCFDHGRQLELNCKSGLACFGINFASLGCSAD